MAVPNPPRYVLWGTVLIRAGLDLGGKRPWITVERHSNKCPQEHLPFAANMVMLLLRSPGVYEPFEDRWRFYLKPGVWPWDVLVETLQSLLHAAPPPRGQDV